MVRAIITIVFEEWQPENMVLKLALYADKSSTQRLYNISITLEQAGYE